MQKKKGRLLKCWFYRSKPDGTQEPCKKLIYSTYTEISFTGIRYRNTSHYCYEHCDHGRFVSHAKEIIKKMEM